VWGLCDRSKSLPLTPFEKTAPPHIQSSLHPSKFTSKSPQGSSVNATDLCLNSSASLALLVVLAIFTPAQSTNSAATLLKLDTLKGLEIINSQASLANYRGRAALHLTPLKQIDKDGSMIALVSGTDFHDGTIEVDVAGIPIESIDPTARGFIGVQFRSHDHGAKAEDIYIRPTNGRAEDQLRRNHSVQYESVPDFPWHRLRDEQPGVYESYVDLETGAWTNMKIEVSGTKARLYINRAAQPCLIVNDMKLGDSRGQIALWAYVATDAYFSNLKITPVD
jgi:hypothetical protein